MESQVIWNYLCRIKRQTHYNTNCRQSPRMLPVYAGDWKMLPKDRFIRSHRSCIVSFLHIRNHDNKTIYFDNNERASISRRYLTDFKRAFQEYIVRYNTKDWYNEQCDFKYSIYYFRFILLVNLILIIKSVNWAEFKSDLIKLFSVSVIHGFYTLIFSSYFATSSKLMMSVLLAVYYLRFLFFPFIFTKK